MKKRPIIVSVATILLILMLVNLSACEEPKASGEINYVSRSITMKEDGTLKILQLTDIHFINSMRAYVTKNQTVEEAVAEDYTLRDGWAMEAVSYVIDQAKPDLIVVTGDSVFNLDLVKPYIYTNDNEASFKKFARFIDSFKIPWLFIFGNHDEEGSLRDAKHAGSAEGAKKVLSDFLMSDELKYCWYDAGPENINGIGNYIVNVLNPDGTINQSLVLLDSGSYIRVYDPVTKKTFGNQREYDCVHDDQLDWYEAAIKDISEKQNGGELVSSILFQHIPFPEYKTVINAYIEALEALGENWRDTIKWDGTERTLMTSIGELTYHGGQYEDGGVASSFVGTWEGVEFDGGHVFERIKELGSTKYVFCGHDHRNTFMFTYDGIRINYSLSIDYSANGIAAFSENQTIFKDLSQRGGNLITLKPNSEVEVEQIHFWDDLFQREVDARKQ